MEAFLMNRKNRRLAGPACVTLATTPLTAAAALALILALAPHCVLAAEDLAPTLIPYPRKLERKPQNVVIPLGTHPQLTLVLGDTASASDRSAAEWFTGRLGRHGVLVRGARESEIRKSDRRYRNLIIIGSPETNGMVNEFSGRPVLDAMPTGAYMIRWIDTAAGQAILVAGRDPEGTWNGAVTLSGLLRRVGNQLVLPAVEIDDWPAIPLRGVIQMIDYLLPPALPHKGYTEGILNFRQLINRMVESKFNALIIHAADHVWRIARPSTKWPPTYAAYRGPEFWREKVREITAYAHSRQVKVYLLLYHTLSGHGRLKFEETEVCGTDRETETALRREFEAYTEWFPDLDGYAIHRSEYRRCSCEECARVPASEEFLRYLNRYAAVLKKSAPAATLAFCPFPEEYYPYLVKNKQRLPAEVRNFLWADWHRGQVGFLSSIKDTHEYHWFDDFAKNWYWVYTNALIDIHFPQAEYFEEIAKFCAAKRVEAIMGQFTFGRATDYNSLALAQYAWNPGLPLSAFRKIAVAELYGSPRDVDLVSAHELYQRIAAAFVRLRLNASQLERAAADSGATPTAAIDIWRDARDQRIPKELAALKSNADELLPLIQRAADESAGLKAIRLRGWAQDVRILGLEIELRHKVREAFLRYQSAANGSEPGVRQQELAESRERIEEARRLCLLLEQERAERGMLILAPISNSARQRTAVEKLAEIVGLALTKVNEGEAVPPNRWEEADVFWRRYVVW